MLKQKRARRYAEDVSLEHKLAATRQAFQEFSYSVAHDLGAPLRCIAGFSQLLEERCRDGRFDGKSQHYVELIVTGARKAQARLAGLLQYSRLGTVPLKLEKINSGEILGQCLKQLRKESDARRARIESGPLPQVTADGDRLALLFYCLLSNALKFCADRPEIQIAARRGREAWVFSVSDQGIGIASADQEVIFSVFQRLHRDEEYPGIGMGLALAKRIAEMHGGSLWVESAPGEGAAFYFTLPDAARP